MTYVQKAPFVTLYQHVIMGMDSINSVFLDLKKAMQVLFFEENNNARNIYLLSLFDEGLLRAVVISITANKCSARAFYMSHVEFVKQVHKVLLVNSIQGMEYTCAH